MAADEHPTRDGFDESANRTARIRAAFLKAVTLPKKEAETFILEAAEDPAMADELRNLLKHHTPTTQDIQAEQDAAVSGNDYSSAEEHWLGQAIGDVMIEQVIGFGGMGTVYRGSQRAPERTVAVKILRDAIPSERALRRFEYEAQLLSRMDHPGIARVIRADTIEERGIKIPYFVMEFVSNARSITNYAREEGLDGTERIELFMKACDAVAHAHQKGIIHRDLKPGNVLIDDTGRVQVIDFGIARSLEEEGGRTLFQTFAQQIIGTPHYMAPEQFDRPDEIDTRMDVYALGVLLYELLLRQPPFEPGTGPTRSTTTDQATEPIRPSTLDRNLKGDLEAIILKALSRAPGDRYPDASALADDLKRFLSGEAVVAKSPTLGDSFVRIIRKHKTATLVGLVIISILTLAISYTAYERARANEEMRRALTLENNKTEVFERILNRLSVSSIANEVFPEDFDGPGREDAIQTSQSMLENLVFTPSLEDINAVGLTDPRVAIELCDTIGRFAWYAELAPEELRLAEQQLYWAERLDPPDPMMVGRAYGKIASGLNNLGEKEQALAYYDRQREIFEAIPGRASERQLWYVLNNRTSTLEDLGMMDEAAEGFRKGLRMGRILEDDGFVQWSTRNLARVQNARGEHVEAFELMRSHNTVMMIFRDEESLTRMNQFYLDETISYVDAVRGSGRLAEEIEITDILCRWRSQSPQMIATPYFDDICERLQALIADAPAEVAD